MENILVFGAGLVGQAIIRDLAQTHHLTAADIRPEALQNLKGQQNVSLREIDATQPEEVISCIDEIRPDLAIGAVPGRFGYALLKTVIETGTDIVDISFFPEDPFALDSLAKKHNVTAVIDCGLAPGMGNIILGYYAAQMEVSSYRCLVGGLPVRREWPWEYKAVFSPRDVIEEYTRPARFVEHGELVVREALSDPELVNFEQVGTLEAWNSDGLRTLIKTLPHIPNMIEKTLRYPGTIEYLRVLRKSGFFREDPVDIKGQDIRPIDLTARLLFPMWEMTDKDEDITVMDICIEGKEGRKTKRITYALYDRFDQKTGTTSMARTTGYVCTAVAQLILNNQFSTKGLVPPEMIGAESGALELILNYLKKRGVQYQRAD